MVRVHNRFLTNWPRLHGNPSVSMALRIQLVDLLGSLLAPLAELLSTPTGALLMSDLAATPSFSVRLWLAEELTRRLGTSARPAAMAPPILSNLFSLAGCSGMRLATGKRMPPGRWIRLLLACCRCLQMIWSLCRKPSRARAAARSAADCGLV